MPVLVVLSDCPPKLRGDMTKWFFEINTGVYIGNFSARVRDNLWKRIINNIGKGHATMVFSATGEQRLDFRIHNTYWNPVDFDGIKLMKRPSSFSGTKNLAAVKPGFSKSAKHQKALSSHNKSNDVQEFLASSYVVLDFETTGIDTCNDEIIEIGAILIVRDIVTESFQTLVKCNRRLPQAVSKLTGITDDDLVEYGKPLDYAIIELLDFADGLPFVCHNAPFEEDFLMRACASAGEVSENRFIDTLKLSQILLPNFQSYKLSALAEHFGFSNDIRHRAIEDCKTTYALYIKLKELIAREA